MNERIAAVLATHGAHLEQVTPLHGGACQENFRISATVEGKATQWALRSDSDTSLPGSLRRRDEFAVIEAAVAAGVQTPRAQWLSPGLLRPGRDAYFLDWVPGEAIGRRVVRNPELAGAREKLPGALAGSLAALHGVVPAQVTLPLAPVASTPARAALTQLRGMIDGLPSALPAVELALVWAEKHLPTSSEVVLVHGDFRTGNFLVTPDGLAGILDWEFAHWGSRYEDLSWISVRDWRFNRLELPVGGFAARRPFYDAYAAASGHTVDVDQVLWWEVIGNLRWAVGSVYQGERYLSGQATDLELIAIARRCVEMEHEALRLIHRGAL
ncbi:MAG: phosphotransferase family protein [Archangium sp.]|nr:phosphotransferase family protein [Archangium sp.]